MSDESTRGRPDVADDGRELERRESDPPPAPRLPLIDDEYPMLIDRDEEG